MKKKILCLFVTVLVALTVLSIPATYAESDEAQVKRLESELEIIKKQQKETKQHLQSLKNEQYNESLILSQQTKEINLIKDNISTTQALLDVYTDLISQNESNIQNLEKDLEKAVTIFKNRLIYNHENAGNTSFLEIIFESENFADFISRMEVSRELMDYDRKLMDSITSDLNDLNLQKQELEKATDSYTENFLSLSEQEEQLAEKINQSQSTVAAFQKDIDQYQKKLDQENAEMAQTEREMNRLLEEIRKRNPTYDYSQSGFIWPLPKKYIITSNWGWRKDPFTGKDAYHNGIDIATSGTSPEIYAIAGGEVVTAGGNQYTGYGFYVIIDHGGGYQSLYGHMNKWPSVSKGDTVEKGQVIGYVGTTGRSTGKHLHFTIYKDGVDVNPLKYVNTP